jgi:hypothetical protein
VQSGTTNVDFNEPMVNALSRTGCAEPVRLTRGGPVVGMVFLPFEAEAVLSIILSKAQR